DRSGSRTLQYSTHCLRASEELTLRITTPIQSPHYVFLFFLLIPRPPRSTLFPYTTLFRSNQPLISSGACRMKSRQNFIRPAACRSEEHTSELQSRGHLVCRLLLEKKKKFNNELLLLSILFHLLVSAGLFLHIRTIDVASGR